MENSRVEYDEVESMQANLDNERKRMTSLNEPLCVFFTVDYGKFKRTTRVAAAKDPDYKVIDTQVV